MAAEDFAQHHGKIGDVSPGPMFDSRRPHQWLEKMKLHLRICGFYGVGIGQEAPASDSDPSRRAFERRCTQYCGLIEQSLGASVFIIVPDKADREDPVKIWNAVTSYVLSKATAGTSTWSLLHQLFSTKYDLSSNNVHTHLAMLLSIKDRIVMGDPSFNFPDKLMVAAILLSIPTGPGSISETVFAQLTMELSRPGNDVDTAIVVNQFEQHEQPAGEHYDGGAGF